MYFHRAYGTDCFERGGWMAMLRRRASARADALLLLAESGQAAVGEAIVLINSFFQMKPPDSGCIAHHFLFFYS